MKTLLTIAASLAVSIPGILHAQDSFVLSLKGPNNVETVKNSMTFSGNGLTATARAYSIDRSDPNFVMVNSQIVQWSPGIGVRNSTEPASTTSFTPSYVDNEAKYDFVLFVFNRKVDLSSVSITPSGQSFDTDVSYLFGNVDSNIDLNGVSAGNLGALGFGSVKSDDTVVSSASRTVSTISPVGGVNALLFSARVGGDSTIDRFKISTISGNSISPVPEPGTTGLIAVGFILASVRRRR